MLFSSMRDQLLEMGPSKQEALLSSKWLLFILMLLATPCSCDKGCKSPVIPAKWQDPSCGWREQITSCERNSGTNRLQQLRLRGGADHYTFGNPTTSFGKGGHIQQIEYALKAVEKGLTVIAIKGKNVICILVERRSLPPLQEASSVRKLYQIDAHIIGTIAGLSADARVLVDRAQIECLNHRLTYEDCPSVSYVGRFLGDVMLSYTLRGDTRPFGCSIVLTGFDLLHSTMGENQEVQTRPRPRIFLVEPSGMCQEWKAVAIGRNSPTIIKYLDKNYDKNLQGCEDLSIAQEARFLSEFILATLMEVSKVTHETVEIGIQTADDGIRILTDDEIKVFVSSLEGQSKSERENAIAQGLLKVKPEDDRPGITATIFDQVDEEEEEEDNYGVSSSSE